MKRHLPPLNALRAFEAAARHESFKCAAEELNVTHAAISHQVKTLEDWLGVAVFTRTPRAVELTEAGLSYLSVVESALNQIHSGTVALISSILEEPLKIVTPPGFAARWLAPRLGRLWKALPDMDLRIREIPSPFSVDFRRDQVDLCIQVGPEDRPGLDQVPLMPGTVTPMCSPMLLAQGFAPAERRDLVNSKLLHQCDYEMWRLWFDSFGIRDVDIEHGPIFDNVNLIYSAVIAAQGVGLLHTALTREEKKAEQLIRLFPSDPDDDKGFYIVHPIDNRMAPKVVKFKNWLLAEVKEEKRWSTDSTVLPENGGAKLSP